MIPVQLFEELKDLAAKLGIQVLEQSFRKTGIRVKSGYCKVKAKDYCIIDKHLKVNKKLDVLGECIALFPYVSVELIPAVRDFLKGVQALGRGT